MTDSNIHSSDDCHDKRHLETSDTITYEEIKRLRDDQHTMSAQVSYNNRVAKLSFVT